MATEVTNNPDIEVDVRQTFDLDLDLKVPGFSSPMNMSLILMRPINLMKKPQ